MPATQSSIEKLDEDDEDETKPGGRNSLLSKIGTPCFCCRGSRFDPSSGNYDPESHVAWPKKKRIREEMSWLDVDVWLTGGDLELKLRTRAVDVIRPILTFIHSINI